MLRHIVREWPVAAVTVLLMMVLAVWLLPLQTMIADLALLIVILAVYHAGYRAGAGGVHPKLTERIRISRDTDQMLNHEGLLARAIDQLPIGISIYDRAGYNRFLSRQASHLLGFSALEFFGKHESEIAAMGGLGPTLVSQVMAGHDHVSRRFSHRRGDGGSIDLLGSGKAIRDSKGERLGTLITFADATELIELETARSLIGYVFEQVDEGILVIDAAKQIVHVNTPALNFTSGRGRSDLIGRRMDEVLPGDTQRRLYRCIDEGYIERDHVDPRWSINGAPRTVKTNMRPLISPDGTCLGAVIFFTDITEELARQESAQRTDRLALIGQMAAGMAHEIRNPLTTIRGFSQFLGERLAEAGSEQELEYTQLMVAEVDRVNALINDFLHLARPKVAAHCSFSLADWLAHVRNLCESEATRRQIKLHIDPSPTGNLTGDRDRLTQLLLNLIDNAFKACQPGDQVTIHLVEVENDQLQIDVQDTGCGIPAASLPMLFDPFFTTREDGTGLGLSICQRIVMDHGGSLTVASTSDQGTTFRVLLPRTGHKNESHQALA